MMMKKVLIVVVCLLLVGSAFALESGPSNKVGYTKTTVAANAPGATTSVPFGLAFLFWNVPTGNIPTYGDTTRLPSMIVGTQANCSTSSTNADNIVRQSGGVYAWRNSNWSCNWTGSLQTGTGQMIPGHAYWYRNRSTRLRYMVLAGEADTTAALVPSRVITANVSVPYSWKDPRAVARDKLNLLQDGFTGDTTASKSDAVAAQQGGTYCYYIVPPSSQTLGWGGGLTALDPGRAYWIRNRHAATWNYLYKANGNALMMPGDDGGATKIPAARSTTVKTSATPTTKTSSPGATNNRK
jgi:hypothetical protein